MITPVETEQASECRGTDKFNRKKVSPTSALMSPATVAAEADVSLWFAFKLIKEKKLAAIKIGHLTRVTRSSFDAWVASCPAVQQ